MQLEWLFAVLVVFWALFFLYLVWLHLKIRRISKSVSKLERTKS